MIKKLFGKAGGKDVHLFTLTNSLGMSLSVTNYGCAVQSLRVTDRYGERKDIVLGFDALEGYIRQKYYIGTVIGRCANRIKGASFRLNGREVRLSANEGPNHLHGGFKGFHDIVWETESAGEDRTIFRYFSPDGEEGYPGNLTVRVCYELSADNEVTVQYHAVSDADTVVNLTNHSYFNLKGHHAGTIEDHTLQVNAGAYTEIDAECMPTGVITPVEGTPLDLRKPARVGDIVSAGHKQIRLGSGLNHNYVISRNGEKLLRAAVLASAESGIRMKVYTTEPGLQVYTGNYLNGDVAGKEKALYPRFSGICLETQGFPNAVNNAHFPSVLLKKGNVYTGKTVFAFDTIESGR